MVIDTSAVAAIVFDEPEAPRLELAMEYDERRLMSAATWVELGIVIEGRLGAAGRATLERVLDRIQVHIVSLDGSQAEAALEAWRRFGKGRHPAGLNMGDCFAYALARTSGEPLLFKGDDFARTDVVAVALPG